jgi:outer membrane receptor protein involved in Fe transport
MKDLTLNVNSRFVPSMDDVGFRHPVVGDSDHGTTINGQDWEIDSWFTIDMQVAYEFGKTHPSTAWYNGFRVALGVQNVTDEDPPLVASSTEDYTDKATYSILGRLIYTEISKKF